MAGDDNLVNVVVKWSKGGLFPVQIDTSEPPAVFKSQLWTLTSVPPERQTILGFKGGKLKDDADWTKLNLKENMKITLVGTPDENRIAPPPKDLPTVRNDLDIDSSDPGYEPVFFGPAGIINLGNTCYLNSTVQCLKSVTPLESALTEFRGSTSALNPAERLTASLRDLFSRLRATDVVATNPISFMSVLRQINPQFAERNSNHQYAQQDAEECMGELLTRLAATLVLPNNSGNQVDKLFSYVVRAQDRCDETDEVVDRIENVRALKCHISSAVNNLSQGVKEGLTETIEMRSDQLNRSANWTRTSRMHTLPPFLIVQFVRFFWKPNEGVKAKILRKVTFPTVLDVYDFCSDELKEKLTPHRDALIAKREQEGTTQASSSQNNTSEEGTQTEPSPGTQPASVAAPSTPLASSDSKPKGVVEALTGNYELCAVLTHKGRAADSGHYVAWVKDKGTRWFQFDDDQVTAHSEEEVKRLCGGGDWHMAYMCFYRAKNE